MVRHTSSRVFRAAPRWLALLFAAGAAACATPGPAPSPLPPPPRPPIADPRPDPEPPRIDPFPEEIPVGVTPPHMAGRDLVRVAILLPFSADNSGARAEALRLLRAAELALFERAGANVVLLPRDTAGTAQGARSAARAAIADGADVILGPLFAPAARAAGAAAREWDIPVIAFSTDAGIAGAGVYLLSFPPEVEVARVVEYATRQGATNFAYLGPTGAYGDAVRSSLEESARLGGGALVASESYTGDVEAMTSAAGRLVRAGTNYQAVVLPEGGTRLRMLGPLLPYYGVDPAQVQFLGTGLWNDRDITREPALIGGWFAGPSPDARQRFDQSYRDAYNEAPSRIAGHAYDAMALAAYLSGGPDGISRAALENPEGFVGVDGLFRFTSQGRIERGLAVFRVTRGGFVIIEAAPTSFDPPVF